VNFKSVKSLISKFLSRVKNGVVANASVDLNIDAKDGDYFLDYNVYHRSLQKTISSDLARNLAQYGDSVVNKWSSDGCGIASMTIAIDSLRRVQRQHLIMPSVVHLCETYREKAYILGVGWTHKGLVDFAKDYHMESYNIPTDQVVNIANQIIQNWLAIVSVTLYFRGGQAAVRDDGSEFTRSKGGHLVVLNGVRVKNNQVAGFFVVDCQHLTRIDDSTEYDFVGIDAFLASYSGKTIYVRGKSK
jgi:Peptidase_C39 like family